MLTTGKQCVPAKHRHRKAKRMGWDGMGWDGMGWDGMGWDGMGTFTQAEHGKRGFDRSSP